MDHISQLSTQNNNTSKEFPNGAIITDLLLNFASTIEESKQQYLRPNKPVHDLIIQVNHRQENSNNWIVTIHYKTNLLLHLIKL